ncbi:DinB family protein [Flavobacterium cellulosilyticum]|uniref:DinB family protein n=1 Tax=Flavobacterium cellulosilyticum TaxID=2541731 RepID=A0A4R5C5J6_9FLAO|nr:DinB family protein [Flavobacterium cellulosilyticum]TDD93919.1 DinB family protein [Flavobacterium cellulosilyticum]
MKLSQLQKSEFSSFYTPYIGAVNDEDLIDALENGLSHLISFFSNIPFEKLEYRYAENKWTVKDILLHLIDAERIFTYRALRIGRGDQTALAGFDENDYVPNAMANSRSLESLTNEFIVVRNSTIVLFKNFTEEQLLNRGTASNNSISVRAIGFIISGHQNHHLNIIAERYL